ncbi:MAG: hypothetical protein ACYC99_15675 [Candidatus Geothermincolia bacterium]
MRCQTCGFEIDDFVLACPQCGKDPNASPSGVSRPWGSSQRRENRQSDRAGKTRGLRVVLSAILAFCLIGFIVFVVCNYFLGAGEDAVKVSCITNQRTIEGALTRFAAANDRWPDSVSELENEFKREPFCPLSTKGYVLVRQAGNAPPVVKCPNSKDHAL